MIWYGIFGFIIGSVLGSFANALAKRSLTKDSFMGRSYCPKCKHVLRWYDLFPVLSYLFLKGKCRYCHKQIAKRYLIVELILGIIVSYLFIDTYNVYSENFSLVFQSINDYYTIGLIVSDVLFKLFIITIFAIVFLTDIDEMLIPDRIILPAIVIAFVWQLIVSSIKVGYLYYFLSQNRIGQLLLPPHTDYFYRHAFKTFEPLLWGVGAGLIIGGFFLLLIIITRGKGMGGGDVKLGAFIGLALSFPAALVALILSFITGAVFSIGLIILGKKHFGQVIPFGPFLVIGSLIAMFWGKQIVDWYLKLSF